MPVYQHCWGCGIKLNLQTGFSFTGDMNDAGTVCQVCHPCRDRIPVEHRVLLSMLMRSRDNGGIGAVDALEQIVNIISLSIEAAGNGNEFWGRVTGQGDNPN